jgi:alpha-beta hydrolase superfamily lysophospholipase
MKTTGEYQWRYQQMNFLARSWVPKAPKAVIVIVHGIGEHTGRYAGMAKRFNAYGFAVTGFDLFGHGESPGKRGSTLGLENTLAQLQSFVNLNIIDYGLPVIIYGHSMGGGLLAALLLKERPPVLAAILSAPGLRIANTPPIKKSLLCCMNKFLPGIQISQGFDIDKLTRDEAERGRFIKDPLNHSYVTVRLAHEMITNGAWCIQNAGQLSTPLLIMHGTADAFTDIGGSREFVSNAPKSLVNMFEWQGAYHELHHEPEKDQILDAATSWLEAERQNKW